MSAPDWRAPFSRRRQPRLMKAAVAIAAVVAMAVGGGLLLGQMKPTLQSKSGLNLDAEIAKFKATLQGDFNAAP